MSKIHTGPMSAHGRVVGRITGTAQVQVPLPTIDVEDGGSHPAEVYAHFAEQHVRALMDQFGSIPTQIKLSLHFDGE